MKVIDKIADSVIIPEEEDSVQISTEKIGVFAAKEDIDKFEGARIEVMTTDDGNMLSENPFKSVLEHKSPNLISFLSMIELERLSL